MRTAKNGRPLPEEDTTLRWTMRIIGLLLTTASLIFIQQDIFLAEGAFWFFGICAGLGVITLGTSWVPSLKKKQLYKKPALARVRQHGF